MPDSGTIFQQILITFFLAKDTLAFNVASSEEAAKFISSSAVELVSSNGSVTSGAASLDSNFASRIEPSYFGYSFTLQKKENGTITLFVGSPKLVDSANFPLHHPAAVLHQSPTGELQSCNIETLFTLDQRPSCSPAHPPNPKEGDSFGLALSIRPDGKSFACSPTRELDCGTVKTNPGFCYKSSDFGKTWNATRHTEYIECPTTGNVDVLFVLDGSASVGKNNFLKVKSWVKNISRAIGVNDGNVSVGVVQYSFYNPKRDINDQKWIQTHIKIGSTRTYEEFAAEVDNIDLHGWKTYTGAALRKIKTDFEEAEHYYKPTTKQVMILLTDGWATDSSDVATNAEQLRQLGVIPYAVGVGNVKDSELRIIANGDPMNNTRVYKVDNFEGLDDIAHELKTQITGLVLEGGGQQSNSTSNVMNFAEMGLAIAYGNSRLPARRRRASGSSLTNGVYL